MTRGVVVPARGVGFWLASAWTSAIALLAASASWLPFRPNEINPSAMRLSPRLAHPFGTTRLGEDLFAVCVHGTRVAIIVAFGSVAIAFVVGVPLGMAAAYFGGWTDRVVTVLLDSAAAMPALVLASAIVLYVGQSLFSIVAIIGVLAIPTVARVLRAATTTQLGGDYVLAARMAGARHWRIIVREIAPNVAATAGSFLFLLLGVAILLEGALSFVGLGVPLENASWGRLVASGRPELQTMWWWSICPATVIILTVLSLNIIGDRLQAKWLGRTRQRARDRHVVASPDMSTSAAPFEGTVPRPTEQALPTADGNVLVQLCDVHSVLATRQGHNRAVDGVTLRIEKGHMLAVVGESGAGKTLLTRTILGLSPSVANVTGAILFDGTDLLRLSEAELRKRRGRDIAVVLQNPMTSLDPVMRVGSQIAAPARLHLGMSKAQARMHAVELLAAVGVAEPERRSRQYPHELSGGVRQRVAIAIALSCRPRLLIADEPTSSLDVVVQAQVLDLIDMFRRIHEMAVLLITHDLDVALSRADDVAVMYRGRVVEQAPASVLARERHHPYTRAMFAAAPRLSDPAHTRLVTIPGSASMMNGGALGCSFAARCALADDHCRTVAPVLSAVHPVARGVSPAHRHECSCWHC